jgi:protein gp37
MENSNIEWTTHTFNPWQGCVKVSPGCKNCYAETLDNRYHNADPHWGLGSDRLGKSEQNWNRPLRWEREAKASGKQTFVFCASMADVFEDHAQVVDWRFRLFALIENTPNLTWQLLTKRPENIMLMVPQRWREQFPANVWIGTTCENQTTANERIPHLLKVPAKVRFLSCEPLLGFVNLGEWVLPREASLTAEQEFKDNGDKMQFIQTMTELAAGKFCGIHWVIAGGESGPGARPMHPDWARVLRDQCAKSGIPFFFKQWGEWAPHREGKVRQSVVANGIGYEMVKVGKRDAGSELDCQEHKNFPNG